MGAPARSGLRHDARSSPASRSRRYAVRGRAGGLRPAGRTQAAQPHGAEAAGGAGPAAPSAPGRAAERGSLRTAERAALRAAEGRPGRQGEQGRHERCAGQAGSAGAAKPAAGSPGPGGAKATLLASFGDWGAYASGDGRTKICYALSQPKERLPKDLKRDPGYLFVSFRPADNVRNEVAVVLGFATATAARPRPSSARAPMRSSPRARTPGCATRRRKARSSPRSPKARASPSRPRPGAATTSDRFSLTGFAQALERARQECS